MSKFSSDVATVRYFRKVKKVTNQHDKLTGDLINLTLQNNNENHFEYERGSIDGESISIKTAVRQSTPTRTLCKVLCIPRTDDSPIQIQ